MTTATLPQALRDAIVTARNQLLNGTETLSPADALRVIEDVCIEAKIPFQALPSQLAEVRLIAQEWDKHNPSRSFLNTSLIRAFNAALQTN